MVRPRLVRRLAAATLLATSIGPLVPVTAAVGASGDPPDIIVILTDDQRWDTLDSMPIVSRQLVDRGVHFREAFVTNSLCCPSRATLLTGNYSHTTGVYRQAPPFGRFEAFDDASTIATWLHESGYETGFFGKYIDGGQRHLLDGYVPPGWTEWTAFVRASYFDYRLSVDGHVQDFGAAPEDYSTDVLADRALTFLDQVEGPAFVVLAVAAPHEPAIPAPRHAGLPVEPPSWPPSFGEADVSDKPAWVQALPRIGAGGSTDIASLRSDQIRSLRAVDEAVGALVEAQRDRGRLDDTAFIYTSDNGLSWGEHRWTRKEVPYEESIRVPLVVRLDSRFEPQVEDHLAVNIDLAPTIAELAGVQIPVTDGRSLVPLMADRPGSWRSSFLVEHLVGTNPVPTYCALRTRRHLYVDYRTGEVEVYDLESDPYQLTNLAGTDPTLERRLADRLARACDPPPPAVGPPAQVTAAESTNLGPWAIAVASVCLLAGAVAARAVRRRRAPSAEAPEEMLR